jgi:3-methylcrotonyl-CoA carboxylase alpha subunit
MMTPPFSKILIANRGEIACRVIRTARRMGVRTVAVYSDVDRHSLHVSLADEAVHIGPSPASESYLAGDRLIAAALTTGAEAIHPGYGFLSENPGFVEAIEAAGLVFIGPSAASIRAMGLKDAAKDLMAAAGVPIVPGYQGAEQDPDFLSAKADQIGYPVLIKARAGGGGKGMRRVDDPADFREALTSARREGQSSFGDPQVLIEKYILSPRHIEVQVFGDNHGNVVHLFERDCSLQRRHQKVVEEAPAPGMTREVRDAMTDAAVKAATAVNYSGAGTIEFIVDGSGPLRADGFWFMEMNTRLQVEHPVTEAITGVDLVEWQLRVAAGQPLPLSQEALSISGHSFEARLYAEDPARGFLPATGKVEHLAFPSHARTDAGICSGDHISPFYDPMIAKIISHGEDRRDALDQLILALRGTHVAGTATNAEFLTKLASHKGFGEGEFDTGLIERDLQHLTAITPVSELHLAIAAIAGSGIDPEAPRLGWRLWDEAFHDLRLVCDGEVFYRRLTLHHNGSITLSGGRDDVVFGAVDIDGDEITARLGPTRSRIQAKVFLARRPAGLLISVSTSDMVRDIFMPDARAGNGVAVDAGNVVAAPMTGVIVTLDVSEGDVVQGGAKLGIIEAMKMETSLVAPRTGRVASVKCAAGQAVEGGSVLIVLEEEAA